MTKSILDCKEIEREYTLYSLDPIKYYDRLVDLSNLWTEGLSREFKLAINQPSVEYLEKYAESDDEYFQLHFHNGPVEDHPEYGRAFDIRSFNDMKQLRNILWKLK